MTTIEIVITTVIIVISVLTIGSQFKSLWNCDD